MNSIRESETRSGRKTNISFLTRWNVRYTQKKKNIQSFDICQSFAPILLKNDNKMERTLDIMFQVIVILQ